MKKHTNTVHLLQKYMSLDMLNEVVKCQYKVFFERGFFNLSFYTKIFLYTILPKILTYGIASASCLDLAEICPTFNALTCEKARNPHL